MITYLRAYGNHTNQIYEFVLGLLLSEKINIALHNYLFTGDFICHVHIISQGTGKTATPENS